MVGAVPQSARPSPAGCLARCDPAMPGLATVLDPDAIAAALGHALSRDDIRVDAITYVKYQPGFPCLVGYRLRVGDAEVPAYATAHPWPAHREMAKARTNPAVRGRLGTGRVALADLGVVVSAFPNDRKLAALPMLADGPGRAELLARLVPGRPDLKETLAERLTYKPQRRYVMRLAGSRGPSVVLRAYHPDWAARAHRNATELPGGERYRLARCLGYCGRAQVMALEWLPGRPLGELLETFPPGPETLAHVGAALRELHGQTTSPWPPLAASTEAAAGFQVATAMAFIGSPLAGRARELAVRLAACLSTNPTGDGPVHGDFDPSQVVVNSGSIGLLDLDRAGRGEPALDLGNFLAHLWRRAVAGRIPGRCVETWWAALLHGYGANAGLRARAAHYASVRLLRMLNPFRFWAPGRRADGPFPVWEPYCPRLAEAVMGCAEELAAAGPGDGERGGRGKSLSRR